VLKATVMLVFILNNAPNELLPPSEKLSWKPRRSSMKICCAARSMCILFKNKKLYTYWLCCGDIHFVLCGDFGLNDENLRKKQDIQQRDVSINQVVRRSLNAMLTSRV
jgi:hypothetical protein